MRFACLKKGLSTWNVFRGCPHRLDPAQHQRLPSCKQQRWQMLKLLEGLGKTANIYNAVRSGESL